MGRERRVVATIFWGLVALLLIVPIGLWASLALWFRIPGPEWLRGIMAALSCCVSLTTVAALSTDRRWRALAIFVPALAALLVWWSTIKPPTVADWSPDVARQVTGVVEGNLLTLKNVRDFDWTSRTEYKERWVTETHDLSKLRELDVFLAWSAEVRSRKGGEFSPVADLFRSNPLVIIASEERDVVRLRSNIRGEDVQLYRLSTPPDVARAILLQFVEESNALAARPRFYNSITTNCTTAVVKLVRAAGGRLPFDWRLIVNGFLPSYLYYHGIVDTRISLEELRARSRISERARQADDSPDFSRIIREGVPSPLAPTPP